MGRTVNTFRDAVNKEMQRWSQFRRTLRPNERELFDQIFDSARSRADAGTMMVTPRTTEVIIISALIDILSTLREIATQLNEIKASL